MQKAHGTLNNTDLCFYINNNILCIKVEFYEFIKRGKLLSFLNLCFFTLNSFKISDIFDK